MSGNSRNVLAACMVQFFHLLLCAVGGPNEKEDWMNEENSDEEN